MPRSRRPQHVPAPAPRRAVAPVDSRRAPSRHGSVSGNAAQAEAQLRRLAYHDSLTGLPNRVAISERIEVALELCRRRNTCVAMVLLDLDDFKLVNDDLGQACGDELLVRVAERLTTLSAEAVTASRADGGAILLLAED